LAADDAGLGGLSPAIAGSGLTAYNLGGVFGALICAVVITRFGSRWPIVICCAGAALTAYLLQGVNVAQDTNLFIAGIGLHGLFVNAVQCSLYALCAFVYPTLVRATGTASASRSGDWARS
jgi:AAHS family 4-hydroxybenzoate transporter-like MFS transporter